VTYVKSLLLVLFAAVQIVTVGDAVGLCEYRCHTTYVRQQQTLLESAIKVVSSISIGNQRLEPEIQLTRYHLNCVTVIGLPHAQQGSIG